MSCHKPGFMFNELLNILVGVSWTSPFYSINIYFSVASIKKSEVCMRSSRYWEAEYRTSPLFNWIKHVCLLYVQNSRYFLNARLVSGLFLKPGLNTRPKLAWLSKSCDLPNHSNIRRVKIRYSNVSGI